MTKFLVRHFIPHWENTQDPKVRGAYGHLSGTVGILCNFLLFAGKLLAGTLSGSVSITADAMNNLSDASSSLVTLIGFRLAEKPADEDHPYGHARFEYIAGLLVAGLILIIGFELAKTSFLKILHPAPTAFSLLTAAVLLGSIAVKFWMFRFNRALGRAIGSATLEAAAADSRNDVITTSAVLAAALIGALTKLEVDGYAGLLVALFILWSGVGIARDTINPLLGERESPELRQTILDEVRSRDKVLGFHDLMVHDYGPGRRFASIHVEMDQKEDPLECHDIIDDIERDCLQKHNVHLVIHYDPIVTDDGELNHVKALVMNTVRNLDPRLSVHDFRMVRGPGHTNLIFDMVIPFGMEQREGEIQAALDRALDREPVKYYTIITFDQGSWGGEDREG